MINWTGAPYALVCHPREEHLLPLHVCLGSNINVQLMDELLAEYDKYDECDDDALKLDVNVTTHKDAIITYSGFVLF